MRVRRRKVDSCQLCPGEVRDAGYKRKIICDALDIDKTQINRMLSVVDRVPVKVLEAGFANWLVETLPDLHRRWQSDRD